MPQFVSFDFTITAVIFTNNKRYIRVDEYEAFLTEEKNDIEYEERLIVLRLFLLFKGVKLLYFTYLIANFTALNLQGITSLHLLTTRVGLLLKSVRLFLQTT